MTKKLFKEKWIKRIFDYYRKLDPSQIPHTQSVIKYTIKICNAINVDEERTNKLLIAAAAHDIGCPISKKKYGDTSPDHQQTEGRLIVQQWLQDETTLTTFEKEWVAQVVGTHHQRPSAINFHFEELFDADLIVNTLEEEEISQKRLTDRESRMITAAGKQFYRHLFLE